MGSLKKEEEFSVEESNEAILYVNGVRRVLPDGLAHLTLLEYLRGNLFSYELLLLLFFFVFELNELLQFLI